MPPDDVDPPALRPPYTPAHFIGRQGSIQACHQWFNQDKFRLLVVTASPGMGKTWLIRHVYHDMQNHQNRPVLWFDTPIKNPRLTNNRLDDNELADWLNQMISDTRQDFPQIRPFDPLVETSRMAEAFATDLVEKRWPNQTICIFIDGCDLVDLDSWRLVERKIIEPIARKTNIRFIITLRNYHRLRLPVLRYSEKRIDLPAFEEEDQGNQQIEKLTSELSRKQKEVVDNLIKPYISSYPGLNGFLFQQARQNVQQGNPQLNTDFWQEALIALNQLPIENDNRLTPEGKCILVKLLQVSQRLGQKWTHEQAKEMLGISIAEAGIWIEDLRQYWLINNEKGHYFIEDGLAQFLQAVINNHQERIRKFLNEEEKRCR
jgi:hypothetical protein